MPTIRKIRTVVRAANATAETDYMIVSIKRMKGSAPVKAELATLPIKYFLNSENRKCIHTYNGVLSDNEFKEHFCEKYSVSPEVINITRMHRESDGYKLFLVYITDFSTELPGMSSSISLELFKIGNVGGNGGEGGTLNDDDVFQKVIKYHQEVGTDFRKNKYTNADGTTKVKPLKLWKTMIGNSQ